jgi:hypothetical protein
MIFGTDNTCELVLIEVEYIICLEIQNMESRGHVIMGDLNIIDNDNIPKVHG